MAQAVAFVAKAAAALFKVAAIKKIATQVAVTVALSLVRQKLAPKPGGAGARLLDADSINTLTANTISDRQGIYGQTGLAGEIIFAHVHADRRKVSYVVQLADAGQPVPHELVSVLIDGEEVTFDGSGNATGKYAGVMSIRFKGGQPDQTADSQLITDSGGRWTSAHRGRGCVYVVWTIELANEEKFPNGRPDPIWIVKGRRLYDPRKDSTKPGGSGSHRINDESTWEWSRNAALVIYDFARGVFMGSPARRVAGLGLEARLIDEDWVIASANACDDNGWTIDGPFTFTEDPYPTLQTFADHMGGRIATVKGRLAPIAGDDWANVLTLTSNDLAGPFQIDSNLEWREAVNTVRASYREPSSRWELVETDEFQVSDWVTEDRGQVFEYPIQLPFVREYAKAQNVARVALYRKRAPRTYSAPFKIRAAQAQEGSIVRLVIPEYGIDERCEVDTRALDATGFVSLSLRQYDPAEALDFGVGGSAPSFGTIARPAITPPNPSGWTVTATNTASATASVPVLYVQGTPPTDIEAVIIEWRPGTSGAWRFWSEGPPASAGEAWITGAAAGSDYQIRIRYRNRRVYSATPQVISVTASSTLQATTSNIASAITGQGALATLNTVTWSGQLTGRPIELTDGRIQAALDSAGDLVRDISSTRANSSNLLRRTSGGLFTGTLDADRTAVNTAAAISGQGALATANSAAWGSQVSGRPTELTDGRISAGLDASGDLVRDISTSRATSSNLLRRTSGGLFTGTLDADRTAANTAAAIAGQGPWATSSVAVADVMQPRANLVFDGGFTQRGARWSLSNWAWYSGEIPFIHNPNSGTNVAASASFPAYAGNTYTLSMEALVHGISTGVASADIIWLDSGGSIISYSSRLFIISASVFAWTRYGAAFTAPSGTVAARIRIFSESATWSGYGYYARRVKFEIGSTQTPFSDEATIADGSAIPINVTSGGAQYRSVEFPLSAASSTSISVSSVVVTLPGGYTITTPSATLTGLTASTRYDVFYDIAGNSFVASVVGSSLAYLTSVSRYLFIGNQSTPSGGGTYPSPPPPPSGSTGGFSGGAIRGYTP